MVYILIAILIFGVLIAVHEFGHFLAAKACGVRVNEFSIGMGPQLFHKTKGDTEYSLRLLPIGGYCAMEGEDEDSDDDRALGRQVWWKKFIIFVAGAFMNFLTGLIIVICLYAGAQAFYTTEIVELNPDFPQQGEDGLMPGDTIYAINGERVYLKSDVSLIMGLGDTGTIDMTVLRDGKKFDRTLTKQVYTDENGKEYEAYGFTYGGIVEATPLLRLQYSWYQTMDYVRIVRLSLQMLLSGAAGVNDLSGPVGIVSTITEVGKETEAEAGFGAALEADGVVVKELVDPLPTDRTFTLADTPELMQTMPSPWSRIWRRSLFLDSGVRYPARIWYEDLCTSVKLLALAKSAAFVPDILYYYVDRTNSITRNTNTARNAELFTAFDNLLGWYRENGLFERYYNELSRLAVDHVLLAASVRVLRVDPQSELLDRFQDYVQTQFPDYMENPYLQTLSRSHKLILRLLRQRKYRTVRMLFAVKDKLG